MIKIIACLLASFGILLVGGCASTMDSVNAGAKKAGNSTGEVMRVPNSFSEGAAQGVAGQGQPNPYNR